MAAATASVNGYMTSTYASKLDGIAAGATANTGTVTSVNLTAGTAISVSGGPVTGSGSITVNNTGVTSAVAGNGIAVSASTGAVTFSAASPTFNTVGSYVFGTPADGVMRVITSGTNYSAGFIQSSYCIGTGAALIFTNNLSGTWKWMGSSSGTSCVNGVYAIGCRVS
jgi:hypothetical protein